MKLPWPLHPSHCLTPPISKPARAERRPCFCPDDETLALAVCLRQWILAKWVHIWPYHVLLLYTLKLTVCLLFHNTHNKWELQSHRTMESKRLAFCPFLFKYSVVIVISNLGLKHRLARSIRTEDIDSAYVNLNESSAKTHSENEWHGVVNTGNPWENCSSPYYLC